MPLHRLFVLTPLLLTLACDADDLREQRSPPTSAVTTFRPGTAPPLQAPEKPTKPEIPMRPEEPVVMCEDNPPSLCQAGECRLDLKLPTPSAVGIVLDFALPRQSNYHVLTCHPELEGFDERGEKMEQCFSAGYWGEPGRIEFPVWPEHELRLWTGTTMRRVWQAPGLSQTPEDVTLQEKADKVVTHRLSGEVLFDGVPLVEHWEKHDAKHRHLLLSFHQRRRYPVVDRKHELWFQGEDARSYEIALEPGVWDICVRHDAHMPSLFSTAFKEIPEGRDDDFWGNLLGKYCVVKDLRVQEDMAFDINIETAPLEVELTLNGEDVPLPDPEISEGGWTLQLSPSSSDFQRSFTLRTGAKLDERQYLLGLRPGKWDLFAYLPRYDEDGYCCQRFSPVLVTRDLELTTKQKRVMFEAKQIDLSFTFLWNGEPLRSKGWDHNANIEVAVLPSSNISVPGYATEKQLYERGPMDNLVFDLYPTQGDLSVTFSKKNDDGTTYSWSKLLMRDAMIDQDQSFVIDFAQPSVTEPFELTLDGKSIWDDAFKESEIFVTLQHVYKTHGETKYRFTNQEDGPTSLRIPFGYYKVELVVDGVTLEQSWRSTSGSIAFERPTPKVKVFPKLDWNGMRLRSMGQEGYLVFKRVGADEERELQVYKLDPKGQGSMEVAPGVYDVWFTSQRAENPDLPAGAVKLASCVALRL